MYLDVNFDCECGSVVEDSLIYPASRFSTEQERKTETETEHELECDSCGRPYIVSLRSSFYGVQCSVDNGDIDPRVGVPYPSESKEELPWLGEDSQRILIFRQQLKTINLLVESQFSEDVIHGLSVMLHGHAVAAAEGYLYSTFIEHVKSSDVLVRSLVESDPEFSKRTFSLSEIFSRQEVLSSEIEKYLKDLIFHNLHKTKEMYKSVLGFDFGDVGWFFKAITIRHHCVHRGGYDKEGNRLSISLDSVRELASNLSDLVESIEVRVKDFDYSGNRILSSL